LFEIGINHRTVVQKKEEKKLETPLVTIRSVIG